MQFRIADTFLGSLSTLTAEEQRAAKITALDLQLNASQSSLDFDNLEKANHQHFNSISVDPGLRMIVHRTAHSALLCYVHRYAESCRWAATHQIEIHPYTGVPQLVELANGTATGGGSAGAWARDQIFAQLPNTELLSYGVPPSWLESVKSAGVGDLPSLAAHLPAESAEALLDLAIGEKPVAPLRPPYDADPFDHPDAHRRFRTMHNAAELARALDYPEDKWSVFLHPAQRSLVERDYEGPAYVAGTAGTGKTVVALHRAALLARANPSARVLLTTVSEPLAEALSFKLRALVGNEPVLAERIAVHSLDTLACHLYELLFEEPQLASAETIQGALIESAAANKFSSQFLLDEYLQTVDAWQISSYEAYRDLVKNRFPEKNLRALWSTFEQTSATLKSCGLMTQAGVFAQLTAAVTREGNYPFDFAIVDEAQDINVQQLRFLSALAANRPNALFFCGDIGQRILQQPFSWKALGVDLRGRSFTLKTDYRPPTQIRTQTERLLGDNGNAADREGVISLGNGPAPQIEIAVNQSAETARIQSWLAACMKDGITLDEIAIFVRSDEQLPRALAAAESIGLPTNILDEQLFIAADHVTHRHHALGQSLEFRAVAVIACDASIVPLPSRVASLTGESGLEEAYQIERNLLYVACTRARERLLISAAAPASDFLAGLAQPVRTLSHAT